MNVYFDGIVSSSSIRLLSTTFFNTELFHVILNPNHREITLKTQAPHLLAMLCVVQKGQQIESQNYY
jgi:hypothetical protein